MTLRALTYGEALIDEYPDVSRVAGAPLHVAVHLAHAGWRASLVSRLGQDEQGARILTTLRDHGVDTSLVESDPERPTGRVTIRFDDSGKHAFEIHGPVAWDAIEGPSDWPPFEALVFGSLAARDSRSRRTLVNLLREPATLRVFDVNLRPPDVRSDVLQIGLRSAHVVKTNDDELRAIGTLLGLGPTPARWFGAYPELTWLCVTRGAAGAELHGRDGRLHAISGSEVDVVDTVGAGDAFTAGLVHGLAHGWEPDRVLAHARDTSASVLDQRGGLPTLPSAESA